MKQIIAIIRMNKMNATKQALIEAGFPAFTVRKVVGRGKGNVDVRVIQGAQAEAPEAIARLRDDGPMLMPSRMMTVAVADESVSKLIEAVMRANRTGNGGDGKIFVLPIEDAVRVRTGERGTAAVN
ncbi:MAG: P-II family nitrogen regulator [Limisphaerales bacterium]